MTTIDARPELIGEMAHSSRIPSEQQEFIAAAVREMKIKRNHSYASQEYPN